MTTAAGLGRRVVLRRHPEGPLRATDFAVEDSPPPAIGEGQFLVRVLFASVDPMLRLFVDARPLAGPGLPLGATIPGAAVAEVIESRHPGFQPGQVVEGRFGWQHHAVSNGTGVHRVEPALGAIENALGAGGLPGFTAYCGLDVAGDVAGRTVLVSGAAGAVGSVVGPLVRSRGGRAVGIAGGEAKVRQLIERGGYDATADRCAPDFPDQLKAALPQGADVYFDNVGGPMLAEVLPVLARGAFVLICGLMAQYQGEEHVGARDNLPALLCAVMGNGVRVQGFTQYGRDALRPAFAREIAALIASGGLRPETHVEEGLERLPEALCGLFDKARAGKVVVRVADKESE